MTNLPGNACRSLGVPAMLAPDAETNEGRWPTVQAEQVPESALPIRSRQKAPGSRDARSEPLPSRNGLAAVLFLLILCSYGLPVRRTAAQDGRQPATASPLDAATATRRIPLYYTRDVQEILAAARESSSALERVQITEVG